jgi:hypothetical protein
VVLDTTARAETRNEKLRKRVVGMEEGCSSLVTYTLFSARSRLLLGFMSQPVDENRAARSLPQTPHGSESQGSALVVKRRRKD